MPDAVRPIRVNPRPSSGEPIVDAHCAETDCGWSLDGYAFPVYGPESVQEWFERRIVEHVLGDGAGPHAVDVRRAKTQRWILS